MTTPAPWKPHYGDESYWESGVFRPGEDRIDVALATCAVIRVMKPAVTVRNEIYRRLNWAIENRLWGEAESIMFIIDELTCPEQEATAEIAARVVSHVPEESGTMEEMLQKALEAAKLRRVSQANDFVRGIYTPNLRMSIRDGAWAEFDPRCLSVLRPRDPGPTAGPGDA